MNRKKSKFVASCFCSRRPAYYLANFYSYNFLITILSLTLFVIDIKFVQSRLSSSFTLILTSFNFKVTTSRSLPTISYLTSLEKYQLINLVYLSLCCCWHSVCASLDMNLDEKKNLDSLVMIIFALTFTMIQFFFIISLFISYKKVKNLCKMERDFIFKLKPLDVDDDYLMDYQEFND